jgi:hypothetical protein
MGLAAAGCFDFHQEGPEDAPTLPQPRMVTVNIEYRQLSDCTDGAGGCNRPVVIYGSWMRGGESLVLQPVPERFYWVGMARQVPVNFPPDTRPYTIQVFDPFLAGTSTGGFTGRRLTVGGETLTRVESMGNPDEHALVFIDDNGFGHNPF